MNRRGRQTFTSLTALRRPPESGSRACRRLWRHSATPFTPLPASASGACRSLRAGCSDNCAEDLERSKVMGDEKQLQGQGERDDTPPLPFMSRREVPEMAVSRREFVGLAAASLFFAQMNRQTAARESRNGIPYRTLGRTREKVSLVGLGGYHLGMQADPQESIRIIRTGLDEGVNFLDNCWDYNGGESEVRMGKALRDGYRQKAFLMSKIDGRTKAAATKQINESLKRLQADRIDLMQFHEVIRETDPERIFAEGGAMEAVAEAQKAGKIRYIGFTGHKSPDIHLKMLATAAQR